MALGLPDFGLCAAFSDACITTPSTRSDGRSFLTLISLNRPVGLTHAATLHSWA